MTETRTYPVGTFITRAAAEHYKVKLEREWPDDRFHLVCTDGGDGFVNYTLWCTTDSATSA